MFKLILLVVGCTYVSTVLGQVEKLKCYHCYESYNATLSLRSSENNIYDDRYVRCDKNQSNWNSWDCPPQYPVCVIMSLKAKNVVEIHRSCVKMDFCKIFRPPSGVTLGPCRECNETFCNKDLESSKPSTIASPSPSTETEPPTTTEPYSIASPPSNPKSLNSK